MNSKFLIVIVLVVAAVHLLLFFLTQRDTVEPAEIGPPPAIVAQPGEEPPAEPRNGTSRDEAKGVPEETVSRAVHLIQQSASPLPPETVPVPETTPPPAAPKAAPGSNAAPGSDATMIVGLVEGQSKLTPELVEVAAEGARAVASRNWERARELYLRMVAEAPDNALGYANLGVAEHQMGNLLAAVGNLKKSLEINPSIAQNWQTLGIIHYERDELELAISSLTRAIHEDPSDARSRLYLAAVIRSYGWIEASITELERAVAADPEFADAHYNLAVSYLEVQPPKRELARRHYYSAIDLGAAPSPDLEATFRSDGERNE